MLVVCGGAILYGAPLRLSPPTLAPVAFLGLTALAAGGLVAWDVVRRRTRPIVPYTLVVATVAIYLAAAGVTLPALNVFKSARPVCEKVERILRPDDEVASYAFWNWRAEYRYYLDRPITNLRGPAPLREAWSGPRRLVLFVEPTRLDSARQVIGDAAPAVSGAVGEGSIYVFTNR
jgi:hypothetical protein